MKSIARPFLSGLAMSALLCGFYAGPAEAGLVVSLVTAPGTDLSDIHVGDTIRFLTIGSSDAAVDEYLLGFPIVHIFASGTGDLDSFTGFQVAGWNALLDTNPTLARWSYRATAEGTIDLWNGFSDCNGLPADTTGCAVTNLGATRPDDSNHLRFTIQAAVPEPSALSLVGVALAALGWRRRKG